MTRFMLFFPASGYLATPKHCETRENAKCQIDPVLPPPPPPQRPHPHAFGLSKKITHFTNGRSVSRPKHHPCCTVFPVVSQTIAATPPQLLSVKMAYRSPKTGFGGEGGSQKKLATEAYRAKGASHEIVAWPLCGNVSGILLYEFWRILSGIFLQDFSGHFFPTKMRRRNPARQSATKSGGPKIKNCEKNPFCQIANRAIVGH